MKNAQVLVKKLIDKHVDRDKEGGYKKAEDGSFLFADAEAKKSYEKEYVEMMGIDIEIERHPLKFEDLDRLDLTPAEIGAVECLLDPEELDD